MHAGRVARCAPLQHPDTQKYFAGFDPERGYLPNAALEELYPDG